MNPASSISIRLPAPRPSALGRTLAQHKPPVAPVGKKARPPKPARPPGSGRRDRNGIWPPTREPLIRWWNDSMQDNLEKAGAMHWVGRMQVAGSPVALLVLGPVEALLVLLHGSGADRG